MEQHDMLEKLTPYRRQIWLELVALHPDSFTGDDLQARTKLNPGTVNSFLLMLVEKSILLRTAEAVAYGSTSKMRYRYQFPTNWHPDNMLKQLIPQGPVRRRVSRQRMTGADILLRVIRDKLNNKVFSSEDAQTLVPSTIDAVRKHLRILFRRHQIEPIGVGQGGSYTWRLVASGAEKPSRNTVLPAQLPMYDDAPAPAPAPAPASAPAPVTTRIVPTPSQPPTQVSFEPFIRFSREQVMLGLSPAVTVVLTLEDFATLKQFIRTTA